MPDIEQPNLTLGEPPKGLKQKNQGIKTLLGVILLVQLAILTVVIVMNPTGDTTSVDRSGDPKAANDIKSAALALEDKGLDKEAADQWELYLTDVPNSGEKPQILYRIGNLRMKCGDWGQAVSAFVCAEQAAENDKELSRKIGPKMIESLRSLGRYGEIGRELSRRVEIGGENTKKGKVLATFAGEAITEADLDRMVERRVDQMLSLNGGSGADRASILSDLAQPDRRMAMFQELLQTELFSRRARDLDIDKEKDFARSLELMEQNLLSSFLLRKTLDKVQPTDVDLKSYYTAFKNEYKDPESDKIPQFEEVEDRVYRDYVNKKNRELMEGLFQDLMARYDVKLIDSPQQQKEKNTDLPDQEIDGDASKESIEEKRHEHEEEEKSP